MTTAKTLTESHKSAGGFRLPDPPVREPEEMTSFNHLTATGAAYLLAEYLGSPETTLVAGEHYISPHPTQSMAGLKYPDLLIAFGVDPAAYYTSNAYIISEQGKPPDFVLEIASRNTGLEDVTVKRDAYEALGIPEYWRFDETGEYHGARLAGDNLVDGKYEPIAIEEIGDSVLQGYSAALNLLIRWDGGRLGWYDPETERHIPTFDDERARADIEHAARLQEHAARLQERARADRERQARLSAEDRVRELEELLDRRDA